MECGRTIYGARRRRGAALGGRRHAGAAAGHGAWRALDMGSPVLDWDSGRARVGVGEVAAPSARSIADRPERITVATACFGEESSGGARSRKQNKGKERGAHRGVSGATGRKGGRGKWRYPA